MNIHISTVEWICFYIILESITSMLWKKNDRRLLPQIARITRIVAAIVVFWVVQ